MKIGIVTGILAKKAVESYLKESCFKVEVISLPSPVAALMSPQYIAKMLASKDVSTFDIILVPGMIFGDTFPIEKALGVPTFKGPKHAADLPVVLGMLGKIPLSKKVPACELVIDLIRGQAMEEFDSVRREAEKLSEEATAFAIGAGDERIFVGRGSPMYLLAEIVNAPNLTSRELQNWVDYYVGSGADIVDLGMLSGVSRPAEAKTMVQAAKAITSKPISIDTNDVDEVRAAVEADVDLILSVNALNMKDIAEIAVDTPIVVTPVDKQNLCPSDRAKKIQQIEENIAMAKSLGFKEIIADPVLTPTLMPNLTESLVVYFEFANRNPETPILFGAGNVTELLDGDSVGANLLLAGLASELQASVILTTEASCKTKRSVSEMSTAIKMAALARKRSSPPKDVGFDLLILKDKRVREEAFDPGMEKGLRVLPKTEETGYQADPKGCFKILLDRENRQIAVFHYSIGQLEPDALIKGDNPAEINAALIQNGLISSLDHAAYLGAELEKAKQALVTGKSYVQDQPLFQ